MFDMPLSMRTVARFAYGENHIFQMVGGLRQTGGALKS